MIVDISGNKFEVTFWQRRGHQTLCLIEEMPETSEINIGKATCSDKDTWAPIVGKKIAFARALESFDKIERSIFWEAFLRTYNGEIQEYEKSKKKELNPFKGMFFTDSTGAQANAFREFLNNVRVK